MLLSVICSALGALSVQFIKLSLLSKILPFIMIILGLYFLFSKNIKEENISRKSRFLLISSMSIAAFYGGLFGIGIGSFILAILVSIGGFGLSRGLAHSRWIVFSINIASTLLFILGGNVLWLLGFIMCIGQSIGATLGARLAIKHGSKIIRPVVICVCFSLSIQLIFKEFFR